MLITKKVFFYIVFKFLKKVGKIKVFQNIKMPNRFNFGSEIKSNKNNTNVILKKSCCYKPNKNIYLFLISFILLK